MAETQKTDSAFRVEKLNEAREKLGEKPFLSGDLEIRRAFNYGLCELLVLDDSNYESALHLAEEEAREQDRLEEERRKGCGD